ncbi:MAG: flagellar basal body P-ring protein FlgI, partial [Deltaproteobacteria bacterium]|nr:flagellar basal body P-ring protein FlgI [Deltaproteobacteria bacterium]
MVYQGHGLGLAILRSVSNSILRAGEGVMGVLKVKNGLMVALLVLVGSQSAQAERLKELADLEGARANQLIGYGLVVGLAGTGDDASAPFSAESVVTMLERLGTKIDPSRVRLRNVAGVVLTAELPAFVRPGQRLDVTVSSIGTAKSLEGGTLLMTPLKGADGIVYALAQGALSTGGFAASGGSGSSVVKNHPTVGRIPGGAFVEKDVPINLVRQELRITLRTPDFTNAARISDAIQARLVKPAQAEEPAAGKKGKRGKNAKKAAEAELAAAASKEPAEQFTQVVDGGTVVVKVPELYMGKVPVLMAMLEALEVSPDVPTKVVINERTGTVVLGGDVTLSPVAIAHGGLTVEVNESQSVSQPGAFSQGETKVIQETDIRVTEEEGQIRTVGPSTSLGEVVRALNAIGATPRDLVAILQALKSAG